MIRTTLFPQVWPLLLLGVLTAVGIGCQGNRGEAGEVDLSGRYSLEGVNLDGGSYEGEVVISAGDEDYRVVWTIGEETYEGRGTFSNSRLVVDWGSPNGAITGTASYERNSDGVLTGRWEIDGQPGQGQETLRPLE